ncbi:hypothetical protein GCM10009566_36780 [Streptomyces murinus]
MRPFGFVNSTVAYGFFALAQLISVTRPSWSPLPPPEDAEGVVSCVGRWRYVPPVAPVVLVLAVPPLT